MNQPLVSIITPCYNGQSYLDRYFHTILNQTYSNLELIFINDGSTDGTDAVVQKYAPQLKEKGIRFTYLTQENAGQAAALNRGLKLFTGEYLTWPDADDEMAPDCIEKKVAYLQAHQEYSACICKGKMVVDDAERQEVGKLERIRPAGKDTFFEDMIYVQNVFFTPGGYMVRASALDETIPNRDIFAGRGGQNAQILLPICYHHEIGYMDEFLFTYYIRGNSHSHSVNDAYKTIAQLEKYEKILLETLSRMGEEVYGKYRKQISLHYAELKFGNSIGSEDTSLIKNYYHQLKNLRQITMQEKRLYFRHTNQILKWIRRFCCVSFAI